MKVMFNIAGLQRKKTILWLDDYN